MKLKTKLRFYRLTRILLILLIFFFMFETGFYAVKAAGKNYVTQSENIASPEAFNLLIGGTDLGGNRTYASMGVRTDVLMLISYNPSNSRGNQALSVISIPRDTNVYIPCAGGSSKINAAASYGITYNDGSVSDQEAATTCTIDTIEYLFDTTIDYYLFANFDTVIDLVNAVDGIDVYNSYEFCEQDENGVQDAYCFEEGDIHLDGGSALSYARQRHDSSDYERTQRQQIVMSKIASKVLNNPDQYAVSFAKVLSDETINNFDYQFLIQVINYASQLYNQYLIDIANGQEFYLDAKSSPYTMATGFDIAQALTIDAIPQTYNLPDLYDKYGDYDYQTVVNRYTLSNYSLGLAHSSEESSGENNTFEVEFISLSVQEIPGTSNSAPNDEAVAYISEIMNFEN